MQLCPFVTVILLFASSASFEPTNEILAQFQDLSLRRSHGTNRDRDVRYRLHVPSNLNRTKHYPIVVWLHGGRERGNDNRAQLRWLDIVLTELRSESVDCFILAPQVPSDVRYWTSHENASDDMIAVAKDILDDCLAKWPVDMNRIYLAGVSSGGTACWEMAMRFPDTFAAVAPMASFGGDYNSLDTLTHVPIWAFHSQADHPETVQETVGSLRSLGGCAYLTLHKSDPNDLSDWLHKHDCWNFALRDCDVMKWLLQQARGSKIIPPAGHETWTWIQYSAGLFMLIGLCGGSWLLARRLRVLA